MSTEANYCVYYYINNSLVKSHPLRNDHLCFILDRVFHTSLRVMGCQFSFSGYDCDKFCTYLLKLVYKKSAYLDEDFLEFFANQYNTSIDVMRFADLNNDVSDSEMSKLQDECDQRY